jgi:hypothetical protein
MSVRGLLLQSSYLKKPRRYVKRIRTALTLAPSQVRDAFSPDAFTRREKRLNSSTTGRAFLRACVIARHPWEYFLRRQAARRLVAPNAPVSIDPAAGFSRFTMTDFEGLPRVVSLASAIYEERRAQLGARGFNSRKKEFMEEILTDEDLRRYPEFVQFCLSAPVVQAVSGYLGTLPVLRRVGLLLSSPADTNADSRLYHLDPEDFRQVKIFVNIFDVTPDHGPLTWLPGHVSDAVLKGVWQRQKDARERKDQFRRWSDEEVGAHSTPADLVQLTGPAGSGAFVDASRCLHFGSRIKPGGMRLVFCAQYLRYHFSYPTDRNRFEVPRTVADPLAARLLAPRPGRTPYGAPA